MVQSKQHALISSSLHCHTINSTKSNRFCLNSVIGIPRSYAMYIICQLKYSKEKIVYSYTHTAILLSRTSIIRTYYIRTYMLLNSNYDTFWSHAELDWRCMHKKFRGGQFLAWSRFMNPEQRYLHKLAAIYGIMKHKVFRSSTFLNNDFNIGEIFLFFPLQRTPPYIGRTHY